MIYFPSVWVWRSAPGLTDHGAGCGRNLEAPNGRWLDSHNARTVYHLIILRALGDLSTALPAEKRGEVDAVAKPAIRAMLDEFDAMGLTVEALPELVTLAKIYPDDTRLAAAVRTMAASLIAKCTDGTRV